MILDKALCGCIQSARLGYNTIAAFMMLVFGTRLMKKFNFNVDDILTTCVNTTSFEEFTAAVEKE